ncbi:MAG: hypothetical protein JO288_06265 [Hyphomicrobiales bacterium]|nr:hypothetical protein [Hyphomicrobiales bacterium]
MSGNVLIRTAIILPMVAALTDGLDTLGFLMNNSVTLASAGSPRARQFALDARVSSSSLSSAPYTAPETQLDVIAALLETLHPAAAEQPPGGA